MLMCAEGPPARDEELRDYPLAERWIRSRLRTHLAQIHEGFDTYRFDLAAHAIYEFIWDEYCDWYIELAKITLSSEHTTAQHKAISRRVLLEVIETSLRALHPIMPFITDEIWLKVAPLLGKGGKTIMLQPYPSTTGLPGDSEAELIVAWLQTFILGIRRIRSENNIEPNRRFTVQVQGGSTNERTWLEAHEHYVLALAKIASIERVLVGDDNAATALAGETTIFVPLADLIDPVVETRRLQRQLDKMRGDLQRAQGKLDNRSFVEKAPPAVVEKERARAAELSDQIEKLEQQTREILAMRFPGSGAA